LDGDCTSRLYWLQLLLARGATDMKCPLWLLRVAATMSTVCGLDGSESEKFWLKSANFPHPARPAARSGIGNTSQDPARAYTGLFSLGMCLPPLLSPSPVCHH
jgi:hypothetical protein